MENLEIREISTIARQDGKRLYVVATNIFQYWMYVIIIEIISGVGISIWMFSTINDRQTAIISAFACVIITAIVSIANYVIAVLSTHYAKVLTHILFINLAIMEK